MMKYKTDGNQAEIVQALTSAGYIVDDMSRHGRGFPDLLVWSKTVPAVAVAKAEAALTNQPAGCGRLKL